MPQSGRYTTGGGCEVSSAMPAEAGFLELFLVATVGVAGVPAIGFPGRGPSSSEGMGLEDANNNGFRAAVMEHEALR